MARILLIDDDKNILELMTAILENAGYQITVAVNGNEGIRQLESQHFDLVVTDIVMPEQDGIAVLMWLRRQSVRPKTIVLTGGSALLQQSYLTNLAAQFSADKILSKPVHFEALICAIKELLD